ncbi:MAG: hypothetical protein ACI4HI_14535 [Lachnospiraceae bacterium]
MENDEKRQDTFQVTSEAETKTDLKKENVQQSTSQEKPNLQKTSGAGTQGQPHLNGAPNMQGQPHLNGAPNMQGQPYPNGAPNMQGQPHLNGAPNMQGQPYPNGAPNMQGQPYPNGAPNMQGQPYPNGAPNMQGQPYPNGAPNMQGQPYSNGQQGYAQQPQAPSQASVYLKDLWNTFVNVVKSPITAGTAFMKQEKTGIAIGLCLVQALLSALFALVLDSKTQLYDMIDSFGLGKIFFITLLFSAVFSVLYAGAVTAFSAVFHLGLDFKKSLQAVSVRSVGVIPVIAIALIVALISPTFGVMIFVASTLCGMVYLFAALLEQQNRDKIAFVVMLSTIVIFIVTAVVLYKYAAGAVVSYLGSSVGGLLNSLSDVQSWFD